MENPLITKLELKKLKRNSSFFVGWYYKFISENNFTYIVIAGFIKKKSSKPVSFVQIFDSQNINSTYQEIPFNECVIDLVKQNIKIGDHNFSVKAVTINFENNGVEFRINKSLPYIYKGIGKNILGPLHYIPFVECKHSIINIQSNFDGVHVNGQNKRKIKGVCYQEKDWGKSFPQKYFWIHANRFNNSEVNFQFAYAKPKWLIFKPNAYIGFFIINNERINLNGLGNSKITITKLTDRCVNFTLRQKKYLIKVELETGVTTQLKGPLKGEMKKSIRESLNSKLNILIINRKSPNKSSKYSSIQASSEIHL